jgi:AAA domain
VLLQGEDNVSSTVKPALVAADADLQRIFVYDPREFSMGPLMLPDELNRVKEAAEKVHAKLIVIDPVSAFLNCNSNSEQSVRRALRPLSELAESAKLAILLVLHLNKRCTKNALYQTIGSVAWNAAARAVLQAMPDPIASDPHRHVIVVAKGYHAAPPSHAYRTLMVNNQLTVDWLGISDVAANQLNYGEREKRSKLREAMEILFLILREGPRIARDVYKEASEHGVSKHTLERAKDVLDVGSERRALKYGWCWEWKLKDQKNAILHSIREKYAALDAPTIESPSMPCPADPSEA